MGKAEKTKQKREESCSQGIFAILIPAKLTKIWRTSCLRIVWCMIENWTVVGRAYFSLAISYRENVASARRVRWPFHSCTIFEAYLIISLRFSEV